MFYDGTSTDAWVLSTIEPRGSSGLSTDKIDLFCLTRRYWKKAESSIEVSWESTIGSLCSVLISLFKDFSILLVI